MACLIVIVRAFRFWRSRQRSPRPRSALHAGGSGNSGRSMQTTGPITEIGETDEYIHYKRRYVDLLQGLGQRPTGCIFSWVAAECRRMGPADDVPWAAWTPGPRS